MAKRAAQGAGTIRKKLVNGKIYWEGRVTVGTDPLTGKQKQKSVSGKSQAEVVQKMQTVIADVSNHDFCEPTKITVSAWLDTWLTEFCINVKPLTLNSYQAIIETHLKPAFGNVKLSSLTSVTVQKTINQLKNSKTGRPLNPKTVKCVHGVLHESLEQAVKAGMIKNNPANNLKLPKTIQREMETFEDSDIIEFLNAAKGNHLESLFKVALFTGMREGEICGLTWDEIDFKQGTITIKHQLQMKRKTGGEFFLAPLKNNKPRIIFPASSIMALLKDRKVQQFKAMQKHVEDWDNQFNCVFTDDQTGKHYSPRTVYNTFKRISKSIGCPDMRFHDLRHTYAVEALKAGDDIKTLQSNLGHHAASFTLQVYAHCTDEMKRNSADRMDQFIGGLREKTGT